MAPLCAGVQRHHEPLAEPIVTTGRAKPSALKDQTVVASRSRRGRFGSQRSEPSDAVLLQCSFSLSRSSSERKLTANELPVVAIDNSRQVRPRVSAAVDVHEVHRTLLAVATFRRLCARGRGAATRS